MAAGGFVHTALAVLTATQRWYSRVSFHPVGRVLKTGRSWCELCAALFVMLLRRGVSSRASWLKIAVFKLGARDRWQGTKRGLGGALETPKIRY